MGFGAADLKRAAAAIAAAGERAADELNAQDGKLGDGDLGITVAEGWRSVAAAANDFPADLGDCFLAAGKAFQRASSSSFGTLVATAFMAAAKAAKGRTDIPYSEIPQLVATARDAMMRRGKASLGDKSMLDSLEAIVEATSGLVDPQTMTKAAEKAANETLAAFRDRPNRIGRARMFAEKSQGLDDPGMLAVCRIVSGLAAS